MPVIVKIMDSGSALPDSDPRAPHTLFTDVQKVQFSHDLVGQHFAHLALGRPTEPGVASPTDLTIALGGMVYIMNEAGKTVSSYDGHNTSVTIWLDGEEHHVGEGVMFSNFLRQVLRLPESSPLYRRSYDMETWEEIGIDGQIVHIADGALYSTQLPRNARLSKPPGGSAQSPSPDAEWRHPNHPAKPPGGASTPSVVYVLSPDQSWGVDEATIYGSGKTMAELLTEIGGRQLPASALMLRTSGIDI